MLNTEFEQTSIGNDSKIQGRFEDQLLLQGFKMLCQWLESEDGAESYMLTELHAKIKEISVTSKIFTIKRLKSKLLEHYKEFIFTNVLISQAGSYYIITSFYLTWDRSQLCPVTLR